MPFEDRFDQILRAAESTNLNVLIWGPGSQAAEHFQKREKIRNELRARFRNADVRFSEDLEGASPALKDLSLPEQELLHLAACDVCVVLDTSKGAGEEIAHFSKSAFARRLLILTNEKYKNVHSFPAALRGYGNQLFFSDQEYLACDLVQRVVNRVAVVAFNKISGLFF